MIDEAPDRTLEFGPSGLLQIFLDECGGDLRALKALIPPIQKALSRSLDASGKFFPKSEGWHDFVFELANAFCDAIRSTNPDLEITMSNEGAMARFLVAIIPHISAENPSLNGVARYVQRNRAPKITLNEGGVTVPWPRTGV
jgi:hypothetical protein